MNLGDDMKKLDKLFIYALIGAVLLSLAILLMPTSINDFFDVDPALYDNGFNYYLWKFRAVDQSMTAKVSAWVLFFLHFGTVGYFMQKLKEDQPNKVDGVSKYNIYLLLTNVVFIILHYIHTVTVYDALAQDTPVWSSQGSVIVMLVLILIIENRRRGLFFGKKVPLPKESTRAVMKYHGIYISLATIFTFWYHPMENTVSHIIGFFYMYLLFIQMSFSRTKIHQNKYFNLSLEVTVLIHGTLVALTTQNAPFAMFLFGFATIFFVTQIYGIGLKKNVIHILQAIFVIIALLTYSGLFNDNEFFMINEVIRIPFIEYVLVFVFVYGIYAWIKIPNKWYKLVFKIIIITFVSLNTLLIVYTMSSYQPLPQMEDLIVLDGNITESSDSNSYTYTPDSYEINIIIIPGGKVNPDSYKYLAANIANEDYKVTIIYPHYNLAILQPNQAKKYLEDDKTNIIIGHSLGGAVGSMVAEDERVDSLILLGSYSVNEFDIPVFNITGSNEVLLENEKYYDSFDGLSNHKEIIIGGGGHAFFGFYGEQKGMPSADISNQDQQDIVIDLIINYIKDGFK